MRVERIERLCVSLQLDKVGILKWWQRNFNTELPENRFNKNLLLSLLLLAQIYSTRDRGDGQAVVDRSFVGKVAWFLRGAGTPWQNTLGSKELTMADLFYNRNLTK